MIIGSLLECLYSNQILWTKGCILKTNDIYIIHIELMKGIQMANVGTKNQKRGGVPFVNVAVPVEDREKLRQIALQEDRNMAKQLGRMIREDYERRFGDKEEQLENIRKMEGT